MKSTAFKLKAAALAMMLAAGLSAPAFADDNSMSIWTGDSYAAFNDGMNFPYGNPVIDRAPSKFLADNPHGLTNVQYAALSEEDPFWQAPVVRNPAVEHAATEAAAEWRHDNPQGLTERDYLALSANSPTWQLPEGQAEPSMTASQLRDRLARFFRAGSSSSVN